MSSTEESLQESPSTSSEVGERGQRRGRGRGRRGGSTRGRGRGRGRGRRVRFRDDIDPDDQRRLQELQDRRIAEMQARVHSLTTPARDQLLDMMMARLPGVMFDVLTLLEVLPRPDVPAEAPLHWCTCNNCRDMPTDLERLCCRQTPENCISNMAHMQYYILDEGVLRLARGAWNDIFAVDDDPEPGTDQREYRHAAYRQFVLWQHGRLGIGNRVVIQSCCVWKIRDTFPDPMGHYTGFRVRRLI